MCGILGFISKNGEGPDLALLKQVAVATQSRGKHAFGLAWQDASGALHTFKRPGAASWNLADLDQCAEARILIGHCRYATHGDPSENANNHPHQSGSGFIVHNGVVRNYEHLLWQHDLSPLTECDSEVLGLLIASGAGRLAARTARAVGLTQGPLALLGLWAGRLMVARRGKPLCFGEREDGFYLASLPTGLPGKVYAIPDNTVYMLAQGKAGLRSASWEIPAHCGDEAGGANCSM